MIVTIAPPSVSVVVEPSSIGAGFDPPIQREAVPVYDGPTTVTPSTAEQTLATAGKKLTADVTVEAMQDATWQESSQAVANPTMSLDSTTGEVTATVASNATSQPIASSGYADAAHEQPIEVTGTATLHLSALAATSYTPGAAQIIIPHGKFLTGDQTIEAVAPPYYNMSGGMAWLGKGAELVDGNLYSATFKLSDTAWGDWTPGSTAGVLVASVTQNAKFTASDMENNEYAIIWECGFTPAWDGTETLKALPLLSRAYLVQQIFRRPNTWALIQASDFNANTCASAFTGTFMRYYGTTTGTATYTYAASYGFYFSIVASTFSSTTSDNPTVTLKTPTMSARCNTTYFSTGNAPKIDTGKSTGFIRGKLYRIKRDGFLRGVYNNVVRLINE